MRRFKVFSYDALAGFSAEIQKHEDLNSAMASVCKGLEEDGCKVNSNQEKLEADIDPEESPIMITAAWYPYGVIEWDDGQETGFVIIDEIN